MPKYNYSALNLSNKKVNGVLDARDEDDLRRLLRAQDLVPVSYSIKTDKHANYRMKPAETAEFSRQLASMLASGITVVRAIEILKARDFAPKLVRVYELLHRDVLLGYTLSEAMRMQGKTFPELLVNMFASGEASGQLERVSEKMAVHYEKEHKLNSKAKAAMTYPMVLLIATVGAVFFLFTMVLPTLFEVFEDDMELPGITLFMMWLSEFLQSYWYIVIIVALVVILAIQFLFSIGKVKYYFDLFKLKAPIVGKLVKTIYTARFARTLSSLYSSGIPMLRALEISATIINNSYIAKQFDSVITDVRNGQSLAASIGTVDGFDKKLTTTIMIGEETGRLDTMLESTAESFDYEAEVALDKLVQLIQPVMIVIMAGIIGTVMMSVMMPMFDMYNNMGI
ncbi:MAG: type II secretion system F family protein [Oscillospiraceae bacterium]|nr:type II secretion system F family protein [Oscillospiraceae bacterium]